MSLRIALDVVGNLNCARHLHIRWYCNNTGENGAFGFDVKITKAEYKEAIVAAYSRSEQEAIDLGDVIAVLTSPQVEVANPQYVARVLATALTNVEKKDMFKQLAKVSDGLAIDVKADKYIF